MTAPSTPQDMHGKVALVTGAASGIGRSTAELFARRGAKVVVSDVDESGGGETVQRISAAGGEATWIACDIANPAAVEALVKGTLEAYGRLDYAVNNAGTEGRQYPTAETPEENWDWVVGVNLKGTWLCMKAEIPALLASGGGAIVNVSSIAGLVGFPGICAYCASKHGMNGLTKVAALEYARQGIRVNSVCPGAIKTPMIERFTHHERAQSDALVERHPMGRMGEPEEIAETIVWLCSDASSFITGQLLAADGGYVVP